MQAVRGPSDRRTIVAGIVLVVIGGLALAGRALSIDLFGLGWPLFVLVPGVVLFAGALVVGGMPGLALAIPGGILSVLGLVLSFQAATGLWATWAYAWALVAPGGVGIGLLAYGFITGHRDCVRAGLPILGVALGLFLGFGIFFEGVLGLSGTAIVGAESLLAAGLVVLGLVLLAGGLLNRRPNA